MHPNNPYELHPPSFRKLAEVWPPLAPFVQETVRGTPAVDFRDPEAARQVTCATVKRDFGFTLELPADRLCPGVPGRLDYLLWIRDILDSMTDPDPQGMPLGIDIGTGASAIYPLLAMSTLDGCHMIGTDIDAKSLQFAAENVQRNALHDRIEVVDVSSSDRIFPFSVIDLLDDESVDPARTFTMCNPPFYASVEEMQALAMQKQRDPCSISTGAPVEIVTEGGEVAFIGKMVVESRELGGTIRWFTSMCGRLSSVAQTIERFKSLGGRNYGIYQLVHSQTKRWFVAWSWQDHRLPDDVGRAAPPSNQLSLPPPTSSTTICGSSSRFESYVTATETAIASAGIAVDPLPVTRTMAEPPERSWRLQASENTWSRAARRKRKREQQDDAPPSGPTNGEHVALRAALTLDVVAPLVDDKSNDPRSHAEDQQRNTRLRLRWIQGSDRLLFESLCMVLTRQVLEAVPRDGGALQTPV